MKSNEPSLLHGPDEPVGVSPGKLSAVRWQQMALRFAFGAGTSALSGALATIFNARASGVLLAFPAILAATITLIEKEEDGHMAREDARGAIVGSIALAGYAAIVALVIEHVPAGVSFPIGAVLWLALAIGLYRLAWGRRSSKHSKSD